MTLLELFNGFDSWTRFNELTANQRSLYLALLQIWNASGGVEELAVPEQALKTLSGISTRQTFFNSRQALEKMGLISVSRSKYKNKAPIYTLNLMCTKNEANFRHHPLQDTLQGSLQNPVQGSFPYDDKDDQDDRDPDLDRPRARGKIQELCDFFEANISGLSPLIWDSIRQDLEEYGYDLVLEAMNRAVKNSARSLSYVEKILANWKSHNLSTLQDVKAEEARYQSKKVKNEPSKKPTKPVPSWTKETTARPLTDTELEDFERFRAEALKEM